ncbi:helix-turn-helix domain-containing protein [Saccharopolyspora sp. 5N102]|uniref:helix-turn-helix domain-containing protein n=1 Tax=Saccharopolyspora sp. 5N102 TaxID=3375155 RepID=UPI0037B7E5F4
MSTARRRQLGSWLTKLRNQAGCSVEDSAERLGCSTSKIRHLEAGRSKIKKVELTKLLDLYEASDEVRAQLDETRKQAEERGWWSSYRLPEWFEPYVAFESTAVEVANFELDLIPGLLQTEEYAREIHRAGRYDTDPRDIDRRVKARMTRQNRLSSDPPLQLRAVVSEAAFHRQVGGPDVMKEQITHIIEQCQRPNVILQLLPYEAGAHASPSGTFVILSFPDQEESIGFLDTPLGGHTVDDEDEVSALRYLFDELRSVALSAPASLDRLRRLAQAD